jgi:hypothetical protein
MRSRAVKIASFQVLKTSLGGPKRTTSIAFKLILDLWIGLVTPIVLDRKELDPMAT